MAGAAYASGVFGGALLGGRCASAPVQARGFAISSAVLAGGLAAMGLAPSVTVLALLSVGAGAANGVLNVCSAALVLGRAAAEERGRVGAVVGGVASGAQLVAYAVGGALAAVLSPRTIFVVAGMLGLLAPLVLGRSLVRAVARPAGAAGSNAAERLPLAAVSP
jgi:MFS family permease